MSYTIGQVAKKLGISSHTLRYYDQEGLLPEVRRTSGGIRQFEDSDLCFLYVILCLKETGMSIAEIRTFIQWARVGDSSLQKRYNLFVERKKAVDQEIERLKTYRTCIEYKCAYYKKAMEAGTEAIYAKNDEDNPELVLSRLKGEKRS